jgi:hypothetical protein
MGLKVEVDPRRIPETFSLTWDQISTVSGVYQRDEDGAKGGLFLVVSVQAGTITKVWAANGWLYAASDSELQRHKFRRCPHPVTVTLSNEG